MPDLLNPGPRCSSCPCPYPICGGQTNPNMCADDNGAGLVTARDETGKVASSILFGWPAPYPGQLVDGMGGVTLTGGGGGDSGDGMGVTLGGGGGGG